MTVEELTQQISKGETIRIELGCGPHKQPGFTGVDILDLPGVDIVADLEQGLGFLPDNSVDEIFSAHFLEHIHKLEEMLKEIHRVLKPGGIHSVIVPHFSNPYFYSDPTHKRFFGLYTFDYLSTSNSRYKRKVPGFYGNPLFKNVSRELVFKSAFPVRNLIKQLFHRFFNLSPYWQEFYEECISARIACNEIQFRMEVNK